MSSDILPTIKIIRDGQEVVINLSDYDASKHQLAGYHAPEPSKLEDMTATQLRDYAKKNDIDVKGLKSKEDLLAVIKGE